MLSAAPGAASHTTAPCRASSTPCTHRSGRRVFFSPIFSYSLVNKTHGSTAFKLEFSLQEEQKSTRKQRTLLRVRASESDGWTGSTWAEMKNLRLVFEYKLISKPDSTRMKRVRQHLHISNKYHWIQPPHDTSILTITVFCVFLNVFLPWSLILMTLYHVQWQLRSILVYSTSFS